ncbi:MAG: hypothetical protein QOJ56_310, partial [Mycobacterium sp.]|nr:hypothetical protein [Mycobacterium sp.]
FANIAMGAKIRIATQPLTSVGRKLPSSEKWT